MTDEPKKKKKKKQEVVKDSEGNVIPQYILDAKKAGEKATSVRLKTHADSTPKILGVSGLDPNLAYRWISKKGSKVGARETSGWAVVKDKKLLGPRHSGGSMIDTHDCILMATTHENQQQLAAIPRLRSKERVDASMRSEKLEEFEETAITKETYDSALQAEKELTNIFEEA